MNDLELQAAARVGQLAFAFTRLDFLLALSLRNLVSASSPDALNPLIERLGFKDKMDALRDVVASVLSDHQNAVTEYQAWYARADRLRTTRNAFVHGRWGMQSRDTVFNASTKIGKALSGVARNFSLADLDAEISNASQVVAEFNDWHSRYVTNAA
ncbi:hypothetical protein [Rhodoferax sediminis]|uniref:RiboL-PSP-HEPN domain-containing protein n=1 Tax=Rhodoferax sediminis TaxID=2509614 RepID=A0A515DFB4_9BURK|nr:hypothetical protein [Rhodoferax sediminis]QDL39077.1 hypothetical protein EUB48_18575 [Rhodoferax sediminis]